MVSILMVGKLSEGVIFVIPFCIVARGLAGVETDQEPLMWSHMGGLSIP